MAARFEITWRPNTADIKSGLALGTWGSAGRVARTVVLVFVLPSAFFLWLVFEQFVPPLTAGAATVIGIVIGLSFGFLLISILRVVFANLLLKAELARGETTLITISDEAIERSTASKVVRQPWSAISRIEELPRAFLLIDGSSAVGAIEKSGVASDENLRALRDFLAGKKPMRRRRNAFLVLSAVP